MKREQKKRDVDCRSNIPKPTTNERYQYNDVQLYVQGGNV